MIRTLGSLAASLILAAQAAPRPAQAENVADPAIAKIRLVTPAYK